MIAHQQRRIDFGIAVLVGVEVEHELPDRALQPCEPFLQHDKAGAAEFGRSLKVHVTECVAEIVVRFWRKPVIASLAEHMTLHIAVLVDAIRHLGERQIWNRG
jgi:hypothetical protein